MDATETPTTPDPVITPPQVVTVVGWLLAAVMVVATGTRVATKLSMKRLLAVDDYLIVTATIVGIGQMVATFVQARIAEEGAPSTNEWIGFQKAFYASELLFIPTICLAKLSVLHSLHQIAPIREHNAPIIATAATVGLMLLAFEFATAFQCSGIRWMILSGQCFDQTPFWQTFGILDIATDAFIVFFPIYIVSTLQMSVKIKLVVAGVFVTRIAAIAASISRLVYLTHSRATIQFDSFAFWAFILNTEIEQGLSVITACIPFLKPFFESLETGMLAPSHGITTNVSATTGTGSRSKKSQFSNNSFKLKSHPDHGISVSRRISTHSDECGLIKETSKTWVQLNATPSPRSSEH